MKVETQQKRKTKIDIRIIVREFEPDVNRTRNLLIWSQTRYHCATDPDDYHLHIRVSAHDLL